MWLSIITFSILAIAFVRLFCFLLFRFSEWYHLYELYPNTTRPFGLKHRLVFVSIVNNRYEVIFPLTMILTESSIVLRPSIYFIEYFLPIEIPFLSINNAKYSEPYTQLNSVAYGYRNTEVKVDGMNAKMVVYGRRAIKIMNAAKTNDLNPVGKNC